MSIIVLIVGLVAAASVHGLSSSTTVLEYFTARSQGNVVVVEWRATSENDVSRYEIERSGEDRSSFRRIASLEAKGAGTSYRYNDETAFMRSSDEQGKQDLLSTTYYYRLRFVDARGVSTTSDIITVNHSVSSVRRTWGMIKEMFR